MLERLYPAGRSCERTHRLRGTLLAALLVLLEPRIARGEDSVSYKYQNYQEDDDRIRVSSHYLLGKKSFGTDFQLKVEGLVDSISGATPTGQPPPEGSDQVPLAQLTDRRKAVIVDAANQFGPQNVALQFAHSTESDFDSFGYSLRYNRDLNEKNTTLHLGYAYTDDSIRAGYFPDWQDRDTHDFLIGLSHLVNPKTVVRLNLTYSDASGFLNDPYKLVQKSIEILPGLSLPLTFPENRPDSRRKTIVYSEVTHHVEPLRGTIEGSYRFFRDNQGLQSHTLSVAWFQRIGTHFILRPYLRWYRQTEADFYVVTLDGTDILPTRVPTGVAPYYSADYRLSAFDGFTYGLKGIFTWDERVKIDLTAERYEMSGRDELTSDSAYPEATILTAGLALWF